MDKTPPVPFSKDIPTIKGGHYISLPFHGNFDGIWWLKQMISNDANTTTTAWFYSMKIKNLETIGQFKVNINKVILSNKTQTDWWTYLYGAIY